MMSTKTQSQLESLLKALDSGELSEEHLRALIAIEAERLHLSFDEAVELGLRDALPRTPEGFDLQFHVLMLAA
jgi:hypothetical protein